MVCEPQEVAAETAEKAGVETSNETADEEIVGGEFGNLVVSREQKHVHHMQVDWQDEAARAQAKEYSCQAADVKQVLAAMQAQLHQAHQVCYPPIHQAYRFMVLLQGHKCSLVFSKHMPHHSTATEAFLHRNLCACI